MVIISCETFRKACPWAADASAPPWAPQWLRLRWITIYLPEEEEAVEVGVFCTSKGLKHLAKNYRPDSRPSWAYYLPNPAKCTSHSRIGGEILWFLQAFQITFLNGLLGFSQVALWLLANLTVPCPLLKVIKMRHSIIFKIFLWTKGKILYIKRYEFTASWFNV